MVNLDRVMRYTISHAYDPPESCKVRSRPDFSHRESTARGKVDPNPWPCSRAAWRQCSGSFQALLEDSLFGMWLRLFKIQSHLERALLISRLTTAAAQHTNAWVGEHNARVIVGVSDELESSQSCAQPRVVVVHETTIRRGQS
jgi:hypothetical protein